MVMSRLILHNYDMHGKYLKSIFHTINIFNEEKNHDIETRNQLISADWQRFEYPVNKLRRIKTKSSEQRIGKKSLSEIHSV